MRKILSLLYITGFLMFLYPLLAFAELYKYVDDNGVVSYTDDYSLVPEAAKKLMETFEEIVSIETTPSETQTTTESDKVLPKKESKDNSSLKDLKILKNQLDMDKLELDKEYKDLTLEKEKLEMNKKKSLTRRLARNNNKNIDELNNKIKLYLAKSKAYQKRLAEYNLKNK